MVAKNRKEMDLLLKLSSNYCRYSRWNRKLWLATNSLWCGYSILGFFSFLLREYKVCNITSKHSGGYLLLIYQVENFTALDLLGLRDLVSLKLAKSARLGKFRSRVNLHTPHEIL